MIPVFVRKEEEETQRKRAVQTKIKKVTAFSLFYESSEKPAREWAVEQTFCRLCYTSELPL